MNKAQQLTAQAKAEGRRSPRIVTSEDFDDAFASSTSSLDMRQACRLILVRGWTWKRAAEHCGVSFGGLHKAMRKAGLR